MSTRQHEQRWYELRDVDVTDNYRHMRLLAVPYNTWTNLGQVFERVNPGAPDKSVKEAASNLPLLLFHNARSFPIGRSTKWTLDDPAALYGDYDLDGSEEAQRAARQAKDGFLNGASIGFQSIRRKAVWNDEDGWDDSVSREAGMLQITQEEIRLLEVSLTPVPAYKDAGPVLVRSALLPLPDGRGKRTRMGAESRAAIAGFRDFAARVRS